MKRIFFFITLLSCLAIIYQLSWSIYSLWQKQDILTQTKRELGQVQQKNQQLKQQISQVQSTAFIEEEARDKLFLIKPNEKELLIPDSLISANKLTKQPAQLNEPHYQQWLALFGLVR